MLKPLRRHLPWLVLLILVAAPPLLGRYYTGMLTEMLIFGIFAMSLDLLLGYTGLISFGHAMFFGLGAYTVVILGVHLDVSIFAGVPAAIGVALLAGWVIGWLCTRAGGVTFLMLTMAFCQLLFSLSVRWRSLTGGSDGLGGMDLPSIAGYALDQPQVLYYVVLPFFAISYAILSRLVQAPLGQVLIGIRQNEARMRAIGFPVRRYKLIAFTIAAGFAGLAGALFAVFSGFISSDVFFWARSGEGLVMVVLGGIGTLAGPVLGAALFLLAKNLVSSWTSHWLMAVGSVFVFCVLFQPRGIGAWLRPGGRG
jgi:branched-chain amino acid transport system permease protein